MTSTALHSATDFPFYAFVSVDERARIQKVDCCKEITLIEEHCFYFFQTIMVCLAEFTNWSLLIGDTITCLFRLFFCEVHKIVCLQSLTVCLVLLMEWVVQLLLGLFKTLDGSRWQQQCLCLCSYICNSLSTSQAQKLKTQGRW